MIVQSPRITIVDDRQDHLNALTNCFSSLGSACLPFLFDDRMPEAALVKGTRAFFFDLHLSGNLRTTTPDQYLANIVSYLSEAVGKDHGPYVLIIWSQYPEQLAGLQRYIDELEEWQKPVFWAPLSKSEYIDLTTGTILPNKDLVAEITRLLGDQKGIEALLAWEDCVARAAIGTSNRIWSLCLETTANNHTSLQQTLGKLAKGARGNDDATNRPGRALIDALAPLVADELGRGDFSGSIWHEAVKFNDPNSASTMSQINSLLHLEVSSEIQPTDRGAALPLPKSWSEAKGFEKVLGFKKSELLRDLGYAGNALLKEARGTCWYLLQINAACDQAQGANALLPYVLVAMTKCSKRTKKASASVWPNSGSERKFVMDDNERAMFVLGNFVIALTHKEAEKMEAKFRVREDLLNLISFHTRTNAARPGIIEVF